MLVGSEAQGTRCFQRPLLLTVPFRAKRESVLQVENMKPFDFFEFKTMRKNNMSCRIRVLWGATFQHSTKVLFFAPSSDALVPSSILLLLVVRPGAPSSVLLQGAVP